MKERFVVCAIQVPKVSSFGRDGSVNPSIEPGDSYVITRHETVVPVGIVPSPGSARLGICVRDSKVTTLMDRLGVVNVSASEADQRVPHRSSRTVTSAHGRIHCNATSENTAYSTP